MKVILFDAIINLPKNQAYFVCAHNEYIHVNGIDDYITENELIAEKLVESIIDNLIKKTPPPVLDLRDYENELIDLYSDYDEDEENEKKRGWLSIK